MEFLATRVVDCRKQDDKRTANGDSIPVVVPHHSACLGYECCIQTTIARFKTFFDPYSVTRWSMIVVWTAPFVTRMLPRSPTCLNRQRHIY